MSNSAFPGSTPNAPHDAYLAKQLRSQAAASDAQRASANTVTSTYDSCPDPPDFQSTTVAPSPPAPRNEPPFGTAVRIEQPVYVPSEGASINKSSLRISTDCSANHLTTPQRPNLNVNCSHSSGRSAMSINRQTSMGNMRGVSRTPSLKAALSQSLGGTASGTSSLIPSPIITAMGDMTPLPSPLLCGDSPGPWKMLSNATPPKSRGRLNSVGEDSVLDSSPTDLNDVASTTRRKLYPSLQDVAQPPIVSSHEHQPQHTRNRSASEYVPEAMSLPKRQITVSGPHSGDINKTHHSQIRREPNLAQSRGLTPTVTQPPTPPPSESSRDSTSDLSQPKPPRIELFEARGRHDRKRRQWRALKCLGQGTFSQVMLATSQIQPKHGESDNSGPETQPARKTLVAIKICEHGPKGGASEERVEMSLKRELEILQDIHHPSLVDLKAWSIEPSRAILVLTYSPGGDLFDVATAHRDLLTPPLLRRVFAELVGAVRYLHDKRIVHRDIKLESKSDRSLVFQPLLTSIRHSRESPPQRACGSQR